jgi:hypothetical protein
VYMREIAAHVHRCMADRTFTPRTERALALPRVGTGP